MQMPFAPHDDRFASSPVDEPLVAAPAAWRSRALAIAVAFAAFAIVGIVASQVARTASSPGSRPLAINAQAVGVQVLTPGSPTRSVAASRPVSGGVERVQQQQASWRWGAPTPVVDAARISTSAATRTGAKRASAVVHAGHVELLGGRIVIDGARMKTVAALSDDGSDRTRTTAAGSITLQPGARILIDGRRIEPTANRQVILPGIGTVSVNEQAIVANAPRGDAQSGPRWRTVSAIVHVRVAEAWRELPAGSEIIVGRVDSGVRADKITAVTHPGPAGNPSIPAPPPAAATSIAGHPFSPQLGHPKPGELTIPRRATAVRGNPSGGGPSGNLQHYVFPVLGKTSYVDTWGAARASTGVPHQGTDIFADEGTPIVAVADGVLDRVGWNTIGGYRFWLYDSYGNSFYHAHLSAFSPLAQDGARVKAGDVIGFVGHTGDAQGTPNHLHFEVHPGNGAPVNAFGFLNSWLHGTAVPMSLLGDAGASREASLSLLQWSDIAANSGLGRSVVDRVPGFDDQVSRPVSGESVPQPTDATLHDAIEGPGISARR